MNPLIVVNFKTYKESTGNNALKLARRLEKVGKKVIVCVQIADIFNVSKNSKIKIYSQHVDFYDPGRNTGFLTIEDLKQAGAKGSLLNHSEHRLKFKEIKKTLKKAKKENFEMIVCVRDLKEAKKVAKLRRKISPKAIAFEVPELIASGKSITEFEGDNVKEFAKIVDFYNKKKGKKVLALCGAGISNEKDVKQALKLGCKGVLIASAVVKSKSPDKLVSKMIRIS